MGAYEYDPPPSTPCGSHTPHCTLVISLIRPLWIQNWTKVSLITRVSQSAPGTGYLNGFPAAHCTRCNIVARSLCLLKAVEQRESPHILGGSHLQRLQHWQADVDSNQTSFYVCRMGGLFSEMLPIFAALHSWWFRFPFGFASHSGVAATPRKRKRLIKCVPVGYLKMYACKNKDPGTSGLFHWIEMQPSRYLSSHFYLLWLFSCQIVSSALPPHKLQGARLVVSCTSPGVCPDSRPLSQWYLTVSASIAPFFCLQSLPTSGSFLMSRLFISDGQNIGVSAFASVLPVNIQGWFPLGWTGWISLLSKGLSRVFSSTICTVFRQILFTCFFVYVQLKTKGRIFLLPMPKPLPGT